MLKLLDESETLLTKGFNHKAVSALNDVLGKMRGMDVSNQLFRFCTEMEPHEPDEVLNAP